MPLSTNFYRKQLALFKPLLTATSLEHVRRGQEKIGSLMANARRKKVTFEEDESKNTIFTCVGLDKEDNSVIHELVKSVEEIGTVKYDDKSIT